jgi:hypothetical protein
MEEVDSLTFMRWRVFLGIDLPLEDRLDLHTARTLAMQVNCVKSEDSPTALPVEYLLDFWDKDAAARVRRVTPIEEVYSIAEAVPGVRVTRVKPEASE